MKQYNDMDHETAPALAERTGNERGFTLIELVVVLVVVAVVIAIAVPTFVRQKSDASQSGFIDAARSYVIAIEAFRTDNVGRPPDFGTAQWPANDALKGPVNQLVPESDMGRRRYMRGGVPDQMVSQNGTISADAAVGNVNHIEYRRDAAPGRELQYSLIVTAMGRKEPKVCFLGSDPQADDLSDTREPFSCEKRQ